MTETTFKVGDTVRFNELYETERFTGLYRVTKVNPKTIVLEPREGGRGVKAQRYMIEHVDPDSDSNNGRAEVIGVPYLRPVWEGEVVTITGPGWREPADQLWAVLGQRADGKVKVAKLGGDEGRYFPKVPRAMLTPVDIKTTLDADDPQHPSKQTAREGS